MNRKSISLKTFFIIAFLTCTSSLFYSCKKDGELVKATEVFNITVTSFSSNTLAAFSVTVNDDLITDSLYNGQSATKIIARVEDKQHILVKDRFSKATLIDTVLSLPGQTASITLLQLDPEGAPILVGGQGEEIPEGSKALSFFYTNDILPDSLGMQIYACYYDPNTFEFTKMDTLATFKSIKRGELSSFQLVKDTADPAIVYFIQPLDPITGNVLENLATPFDPTIASGYFLSFEGGPLGTEKHYINSIEAMAGDGVFDIASNRLISY
ncbi:hypothetical protein [Chitinophaga tropicalis]|nr:hypothetical protein [Chitinophaga tropicalis]